MNMNNWKIKPISALKLSLNYCGVCGRRPKDHITVESNYGPVMWWDPDDGWKIGSLCRTCHGECPAPKEEDLAYENPQLIHVPGDDSDPIEALL